VDRVDGVDAVDRARNSCWNDGCWDNRGVRGGGGVSWSSASGPGRSVWGPVSFRHPRGALVVAGGALMRHTSREAVLFEGVWRSGSSVLGGQRFVAASHVRAINTPDDYIVEEEVRHLVWRCIDGAERWCKA
jgi:hypothetical protein